MRTWISFAAALTLSLGCGSPSPTSATPPSPAAPSSTSVITAPTGSATVTPSASAASGANGVNTSTAGAGTADAGGPKTPPAPVTRVGKGWPFHTWDRAEALTYNRFQMRPGVQFRVYEERGWNEHLGERKVVTTADAQRAIDLIKQTEGGVAVSKCGFPRHAVVLYEGEVPVASINVCFECGDIMIWPEWKAEPDWEKLTDKQRKALAAQSDKQLKRYDQVFPKWKTFFRDDIGFPLEYK